MPRSIKKSIVSIIAVIILLYIIVNVVFPALEYAAIEVDPGYAELTILIGILFILFQVFSIWMNW